MIQKFIKIKGVGKFADFSTTPTEQWNGELKSTTLIYGENGIGKTTLSLILKSLKEDDALLCQLKSFGNINQEVMIKFSDEQPIIYEEGVWSSNKPYIEIFDIHFINDNIYTGFEIQPQHRKNLFEIVIGSEGIKLKNEISEVKTQIKDKNTELKLIENKVYKIISGFDDISKIIILPVDANIDQNILNKEKEIVAAKAAQKIKNTSEILELKTIDYGIRFERLKEFLQTTVDTISQEYLEMVEEHKNSLNLADKSEQWIKDGFENIIDDKCPFCLRDFNDSVEIIKAYNQYFNEQYKALQRNSIKLQEKMNSLNPEFTVSEIEAQINHNEGYIEFWRNYINCDIKKLNFDEDKTNLITATKNLTKIVNLKAINPIQPVGIEDAENLEHIIDLINKCINIYNEEIQIFNKMINELKNKVIKDIAILEKELQILKAIKLRHSEKVIELCNNFSSETDLLDKLKDSNTKLQKKLKIYTNTTFDKYKSKINEYLTIFASYMEIREMKSTYKGGGKEPYAEYGLYIQGNKIKFKDDFKNPSVKYSLSEGDKSALALSFFFAKLYLEENIQQSIVIFDDPISSFDLHRKSSTITQLLQLNTKIDQLILLTHNLLFAKDFWDKVKSNCQVLKIVYSRNSSRLIEYDIESDSLNGLFKDYKILDLFLKNGAKDDIEKRNIARCIRPILEGYFRVKFYGIFKDNEWLGDFLSKVTNSNEDDNLFSLKEFLPDLNELNDFSKKFHHTNPNADNEPIYDSELERIVKKTFDTINRI